MEGYFKPIQLFHPSNYPDHNNQLNSHSSHNHNHSNHNHTHSNGNAQQASLQQSLHSSQPIQNQMVYSPFEVKQRKRTSRHQFKILEETFQSNQKPSALVRKDLAEQLEMTPRGVQIWFQNRRAKAKAQLRKQSNDTSIDINEDSDSTPAPTLTPAPTNATTPSVLSIDPPPTSFSSSHSTNNLLYPSPLPSPASASLLPNSTSLSPTSLISNPLFDNNFNITSPAALAGAAAAAGRRGSAPVPQFSTHHQHQPTSGLGLSIPSSHSLSFPLNPALTNGGNIGPVRRASLPNFQTRRSNQSLRHSASRSKLATCTEETLTSSPLSANNCNNSNYINSNNNDSNNSSNNSNHNKNNSNSSYPITPEFNQQDHYFQDNTFSDPSSPTSMRHHPQLIHSSSSNSLSHALATSDTFWRENSNLFDNNDDRRQSIMSSNYDNNSLFDQCRRDSEVSTSATTTFGGCYDTTSLLSNPSGIDHRRSSCPTDFIHTFEEFGVSGHDFDLKDPTTTTTTTHSSNTDFTDYTLDPKDVQEVEAYVHC